MISIGWDIKGEGKTYPVAFSKPARAESVAFSSWLPLILSPRYFLLTAAAPVKIKSLWLVFLLHFFYEDEGRVVWWV